MFVWFGFFVLMAYQPSTRRTVGNYLTHSWEDKDTFPKGICLKVNVIPRLEYEFAYYDSVVRRFNHYTTRTSPRYVCMYICMHVWLYIYINLFLHLFIYLCLYDCRHVHMYICIFVRMSICWLIVWVLWHINLCSLFNTKSIFIQIIISISNNSVYHKNTV